jgi:hypothetical protein
MVYRSNPIPGNSLLISPDAPLTLPWIQNTSLDCSFDVDYFPGTHPVPWIASLEASVDHIDLVMGQPTVIWIQDGFKGLIL